MEYNYELMAAIFLHTRGCPFRSPCSFSSEFLFLSFRIFSVMIWPEQGKRIETIMAEEQGKRYRTYHAVLTGCCVYKSKDYHHDLGPNKKRITALPSTRSLCDERPRESFAVVLNFSLGPQQRTIGPRC